MPSEALSTKLTLDYQAVENSLMEFGRQGLVRTGDDLLRRAKKYAPVRDIFKGDTRRAERVPRGIQRRRRYKHQHRVFGRKIRHWQDSTRDRFLAQVKAQRPHEKRITTETGKRIQGSHRSLIPVLDMRDREGRKSGEGRISADFRRATISGAQVELEAQTFRAGGRQTTIPGTRFLSSKGRGEVRRINKLLGQYRQAHESLVRQGKAAGSADSAIRTQVERASLTRRGALEISSEMSRGEKLFRRIGLHADASGDIRIGGRLRDEIYLTEVTRSGSTMYVEVVSPTEYAKYQEYGTSKHKAQPYMRPALYEMREQFRTNVSRAMRSRGTR